MYKCLGPGNAQLLVGAMVLMVCGTKKSTHCVLLNPNFVLGHHFVTWSFLDHPQISQIPKKIASPSTRLIYLGMNVVTKVSKSFYYLNALPGQECGHKSE